MDFVVESWRSTVTKATAAALHRMAHSGQAMAGFEAELNKWRTRQALPLVRELLITADTGVQVAEARGGDVAGDASRPEESEEDASVAGSGPVIAARAKLQAGMAAPMIGRAAAASASWGGYGGLAGALAVLAALVTSRRARHVALATEASLLSRGDDGAALV